MQGEKNMRRTILALVRGAWAGDPSPGARIEENLAETLNTKAATYAVRLSGRPDEAGFQRFTTTMRGNVARIVEAGPCGYVNVFTGDVRLDAQPGNPCITRRARRERGEPVRNFRASRWSKACS
jgi:hypothetical protein